jgi:S1-C subfamily serine protease
VGDTLRLSNSGGALLDSSGRLMGICTALVGPSSAPRAGVVRASSLGFAVPVDTVRAVVPQLIAYGRVVDPV